MTVRLNEAGLYHQVSTDLLDCTSRGVLVDKMVISAFKRRV